MRGQLVTRTWEWNPVLHAPPRYRRACRYEAFVPEKLSGTHFPLSTAIAGVVSEAEQAISTLNAQSTPALAPLARLLLRTESVASSRVEGLQVGVAQLARAEARVESGGRAAPTVLEVLRNIEAMQTAVDEAAAADRFGVEHILAIHLKLMAGATRAGASGTLRTSQNWIGGNDYNPCGADFVPPPPEHVPQLVEDLCDAMGEESVPPLVQAAMAHAQFETIHPFDDGNGRTGRALVHVVLRRRGIAPSYVPPISVALAMHRTRYIDGLTRFRAGEVGLWIERFAGAAALSSSLAISYLRAVSQLMEEWRRQLTATVAPRSDAAAWAIIDILPAHPVVTAPVAAAATGRAKSAIHHALEQLVASGVLAPLSQSKRNRSWEAVGLLDLLEGLEAGRVPNG